MTKSYPNTLTLSRRALRVLTKLNLLMGALILALLIASVIAESWVMRALGARPAPGNSMLFVGMRLIMVIGLCGVPIVHLILARLLTIIETVSVGNPFVVANAVRLRTIACAKISKARFNHADHRQRGRDASRASNDAHGAVRENRNHARQPVDPENRKGARRPILHARGHLRGTAVPAR